MNLTLRKPMPLPEFLEWEPGQEFRYESDGFQPVAMTGRTRAHATIQRNFAVSLADRLRGKSDNFLESDLKIEAAGRIRYPDGFVVGSPGPNTSAAVTDPIVVFEHDRIAETVFARAGGDWIGHVFLDGAILALPEIGIDVPSAEFYDGLVFDEPGEAEDGAPRTG